MIHTIALAKITHKHAEHGAVADAQPARELDGGRPIALGHRGDGAVHAAQQAVAEGVDLVTAGAPDRLDGRPDRADAREAM